MQKAASTLATLLKHPLLKSGALVYVGSVANAGLTFVASIILARLLGPSAYGLFATAFALLYLITELTDLGINPSVVRYGAQYIQEGRVEHAQTTFRYALRTRSILTAVLVIGGVLLAPAISTYIFKLPELTPLLRIAFLGIIPLVGLSYLTSIFQSEQRFGPPVLIGIISGVTKLLVIGLLAFTDSVSATNALIGFALAPLLAFVIALFQVNSFLLKVSTYKKEVVAELRTFSIWMAIWALFAILQGKLDQFMVTSMLGTTSAGLYAAAYQLAMLVSFMGGALGTVLNPRIAALSRAELRLAFSKTTLFSLVFAAIIGVLVLGGWIALPLFFGTTYADALPSFVIIMAGLFFFGAATLPNAILTALKKPYIFSASAIGGLVLSFLFNLLLIPSFGIEGASTTFFIVNAAGWILSTVACIRFLHERYD